MLSEKIDWIVIVVHCLFILMFCNIANAKPKWYDLIIYSGYHNYACKKKNLIIISSSISYTLSHVIIYKELVSRMMMG